MAKTNKSGNMRGMSEGSKKSAKRNSFKNKSKEELREISEKGHEAYRIISSINKTAGEIAKEEAEEEIANKTGEKIPFKRAMIKKLKQMVMNGNINALILFLKLIGEMPSEKLDIKTLGFNVVVADDEHKQMLEDL